MDTRGPVVEPDARPDPARELAGRVAVITGGARGQGRSHAVTLARMGADIAITDLGHDLGTVAYPLGTADELAETVRLVEAEGRRCIASLVDVRDLGAMISFVDEVAAEFGGLDIAVANAGVSSLGSIMSMTASDWSETVETNLTGVFNTLRSAAPHLRRRRWGRMIGISSMMGRSSNPGIAAYTASKWGVIGLCKSVAQEMAHFSVTVNAIAPGNISTPMIHNPALYQLMRPDLEDPGPDDVAAPMTGLHVQPVPWLEPDEVSAAVAYLCSHGARHVTGTVLNVDAGASARFTG